jgi:hypothetical protein
MGRSRGEYWDQGWSAPTGPGDCSGVRRVVEILQRLRLQVVLQDAHRRCLEAPPSHSEGPIPRFSLC